MASPTNERAIEDALAKPGYIPSDITADFLKQSRDKPVVIAILFVGCFVSFIMVLRCVARVLIAKKFHLDDWLALITMLPFWTFVSLCMVLIHLGSGRHFVYIEYILDNATINKTEVIDFVAHILYTTALVVCRLSGLALYARISDRHPRLTWANRAAAAFIFAAYLPQVFLLIFHCLPVTGLWPYSFQPELNDYTCLQWGTVYVTNSAISVVCDLILFALPAAIISSLRMSIISKIKLSMILMPGLLVIGISCARMYFVIVGQWEADESWSYDYLLAIEVSEIGATLVALSVPALKPLFGSMFETFDRTFISRNATARHSSAGIIGPNEQKNRKRSVELESVFGGMYSRPRHEAGGQEEAVEDFRLVSTNGLVTNQRQYSAHAFHTVEERKRSTTSTASQQPMIQRDLEYTVSYEDRDHR